MEVEVFLAVCSTLVRWALSGLRGWKQTHFGKFEVVLLGADGQVRSSSLVRWILACEKDWK